MSITRSLTLVAAAILTAGIVSCESGGAPEKPADDGGAASTAAPSAAVLAKLAAADGVDGKTDKIIGKCIGCGLGMEGSADHASKIGEYTAHLCSADCKANFDKDSSKLILALKTPPAAPK